jgi:hypothetical protein
MKVPTKFIKTLSEEEHSRLVENHQRSENFRLRKNLLKKKTTFGNASD